MVRDYTGHWSAPSGSGYYARVIGSFDLSTFLNTAGRDFLEENWPGSLFVGHGPRSRLRTLLEIASLKSGAAFMKMWTGTASAWPRPGTSDALRTIQSRDLAKFHRAGYTLYFTRVEDECPELNPFLRRIERDLGLRRGDMTSEAILSRKGSGAVPHFDADCTFNLQVEGKKRWHVAANTSVSSPHKAGMMRDAVHPEMAGYANQLFPSSMPPDAQTFVTTAGSVVFLPHGSWHGTQCV